jgi:hypothetical protein
LLEPSIKTLEVTVESGGKIILDFYLVIYLVR